MGDFLPGLFDQPNPDLSPIDVDCFAGGGGASTGMAAATGKDPDIAINHCERALAMHEANHPYTKHLHSDVWEVDIRSHTGGRPVRLMWASPDCTHFSRARGSRPTSPRVRGLAWIVPEYCQKLGSNRPQMIFMENVREFLTWEHFPEWKASMKRLGYKLEHRVLKACDYGAPTIRERLFIILRRDGNKICWPHPTHGPANSPEVLAGHLKPYRTAADIIDFSLPCPSIFLTPEEVKEQGLNVKRPLSEKTLVRIAQGIKKFVIEAKEPFILNMSHGGRCEPILEPMRTITTTKGGERTLIMPTIERAFGNSSGASIQQPIGAITANGGGKAALVAAFLAQHNTGVIGRSAEDPLSTITATGTQQALVTSHLMNMKGTSDGHLSSCSDPATDPLRTITAGGNHAAEVRAFLVKYYGTAFGSDLNHPMHTVTTVDRFGLVTIPIGGVPYVFSDIGMRMLTPEELFAAQGFPTDYKIRISFNGKPLSKREMTSKCGNSVPPVMAEALINSNLLSQQ